MVSQATTRDVVLSGMAFLAFVALIPGLPGVKIDMDCWQAWALHIHREALPNAYSSGTNYPPLYQYFLWAFARLAGSEAAIIKYLGYLRVFTLLAEYWGLWIIYRWMEKRVDWSFLLLCSMLNVAYSYNTMLWGQVDAMLAALVVSSLYYQWRGKLLTSAIFLVLALNLKIQTIIFIPMWGLLMLGALHRAHAWRRLLVIVPAMVVAQVILLIPFMLGKDGLGIIWKIVAGLPDAYPWISLNAYNIWYWITLDAMPGNPDNVRSLFGLTYYHLGLIGYVIALAVVLWPLARHTLRTLAGRITAPLPRETIWLTAALSTLVFFYFNTRMHERYFHPAFIFVAAYAFYNKRYGIYALFSLAAFLNMELVVQWLRLPNYDTFIFAPRFIAALWAGVIGWCFWYLHSETVDKTHHASHGTPTPPAAEQ